MAFSIHADLLSEQKKTAYEPSLSLTVSDHGWPRSLPHHSLSGQDNEPTAAVSIPGVAIVRARHNTGVGVELQRITDPETKSQWESWSLFQADAGYPALFYTGTYVVLVYQKFSPYLLLCSRRSSDGGQTWGSEQSFLAIGYTLDHFQVGVSGGADDSGLFFAYGPGRTLVSFSKYLPASDTWELPQVNDYGETILGLGAAWTGVANTYRLALAFEDFYSYADRSLTLADYTYPAVWATPAPYLDLQGATAASYDVSWPSLARLSSGVYWLSFRLAGDQDAGALFNSAQCLTSSVGSYFRLHRRLSFDLADRLSHLEWSGGVVYSAAYDRVLKSAPVATLTATEAEIVSYRADDQGLEVTLDNRSGAFAALSSGYLGARLSLERGAIIGGVARRVALPDHYLDGVEGREQDGRLVLRAGNVSALLGNCRPELSFRRAGLLPDVITELAALAGVGLTHSLFNTSTISVTTSLNIGQSAGDAIGRLLDQYKLSVRPAAGSVLELRELALVADTVNYDLTGHPIFVADRQGRRVPGHTSAFVFGAGVGGQDSLFALESELGRSINRMVTRQHITTVDEAIFTAELSTDLAEYETGSGMIDLLPAFQLQLHDVVTYGGEDYFIGSFRERYKLDDVAWSQSLALGLPDRGNSTILRGDSLGDGPRRATVVSFDDLTWKAAVRLDGSASTIEMACGQWLASSLLTEGAAVAVLLFDESNPADGLIVGPYGAASPVLDDYLALSHNHDAAYVNEGQAASITAAMLVDGAALAEILDDDGAGSGLDADLLDGSHASAFALSGHTHSYVATSDYEDSDVLTKIKNVDGAASGLDADFLDGSHASAFAVSGHTHSYVATSDYEDSDVLAKIKNVDGASSGLDADLLDGSHASAFAAASHAHAAGDITSGTMATARLGSGSASSSTFLRGDQTWAAAGGTPGDDAARVSKLYESDFGAVALSADASGYLSASTQPLVVAYKSSPSNNVTGDTTVYTVVMDTEIVDRNSNYNASTGIFTAPAAGHYLIIAGVNFSGITSSHIDGRLYATASNRTGVIFYTNPYAISSGGYCSISGSVIIDMDAGDTMAVQLFVAGGSKVIDIYGDATNMWTYANISRLL